MSWSSKIQKILDDLFNEKVDSRHGEIKCRRLAGTGKWFLESPQFNDWMRGDSGSPLIWAHGIAGAGKTFISSLVIDHLSNDNSEASSNNVGVAHIYFGYKEQGSQGISNILSSLIKQLCQQVPQLSQLSQLPPYLANLTSDERIPSHEDLFLALVETSKSFVQTFLVFDALDECDRKTQREILLPMLHRMGENGFRVFMTSRRYEGDFEDSFRNVPSIEIIAHDDDLKRHILKRLDEYLSTKRMIQIAGLEDEVISRLIKAAGGRFLFVDLNIPNLCEQPTGRHVLKELEKLQNAKTTDESMDLTYDLILEIIRKQPKVCAALAIKTLTWIVTARRILTAKELQTAASLDAKMTRLDKMDMLDGETLVEICFGLVVMDNVTKTVRLAHITTEEYLIRKGIVPQNFDTTLAIICTTYLSFDEFKTDACSLCKDSVNRCDTHYFFDYAVKYLSVHLNSSDQESTMEVFRRFLENKDNVSSYYDALRRQSKFIGVPAQPIPLLDASAMGHTVMVKHLLENGCNISTTDQYLLTSLHLASHNGHLNVVKLLLEKGANPNTINKRKDTPLHLAALSGHTDVARLLLDSGADATLANDIMTTPLHCAARSGHLDIVKLLLERGANPNAVDASEDTPLRLATSSGHTDVARFLKSGAD